MGDVIEWLIVLTAVMLGADEATPTPESVAADTAEAVVEAPAFEPYRYWPPSEREAQQAYEVGLNVVPTATSVRAYHEMIAQEPHPAGSEADLRAADRLAAEFEKLGLEVEKQELWLYLATPVEAAVEIVTPSPDRLRIKEKILAEDRYSGHPDLSFGWNAFSGNGDVTGEVVYANYGTKEDFEHLKTLGIEVKGKIVIARYGGNFRGYKAKFAEEAGAVGLIIYTDPANSGYVRGLMYPEGGYANETSIQRGSIETLPYAGDPLTPGVAATKDAKRKDPSDVSLPTIPVQPIGWEAAGRIMSQMRGQPVPSGWQGGLPFTYRLNGGETLTVRLMVKQKRELTKTYNVVGTLKGEVYPDEKVIVGCHHDAWTFGAGDPLAGTMVVYEAAKSFATLAKQGRRPKRSIVFANWGAEEYGIMGSSEWIEAHSNDLYENAVAYINLDMAAMGPHFGSSASPLLKTVIEEASKAVPPVGGPTDETNSVHDAWVYRNADPMLAGHPRFGHLGGGSDHVGFLCHLAIPSASLGGGGARGTSYHSAYDDLIWYRKVVGESYEPALMVTRVTNVVLARLANGAVLPLDPTRYAPDFEELFGDLIRYAEGLGIDVQPTNLLKVLKDLDDVAMRVHGKLMAAVEAGALSEEQTACVNKHLLQIERKWLVSSGLPERPWFRSMYAAPDESSGYAPWMLPALRYGIERKADGTIYQAKLVYRRTFGYLIGALQGIETCLDEGRFVETAGPR